MLRERQPLPIVDRLVLRQQHRLPAEAGEERLLVAAKGGEVPAAPPAGRPALRATEGPDGGRPHLLARVDAAEKDDAPAKPLRPVEERAKRTSPPVKGRAA